jgi:hypothetical protein
MVSFGTNLSRDYLPTFDLKKMLEGLNQPLAANIILLFTDGSPYGYTAKFPGKLLACPAQPILSNSSPCMPHSAVSLREHQRQKRCRVSHLWTLANSCASWFHAAATDSR